MKNFFNTKKAANSPKLAAPKLKAPKDKSPKMGLNNTDTLTQDKKIWAVVPAAGTGQRMRSVLPKQYLPLMDYTVIEITLHKLLEIDEVHRIVVAVDKDDDHWSALEISKHDKIDTVIGGSTRQSSVYHALQFIHAQEQQYLNDKHTQSNDSSKSKGVSREVWEDEWVLVHDAARPCVSLLKVDELIRISLLHNTGAILASPVTHTVKESMDGVFISQSKNRDKLWLANTPQMFPLAVLSASLEKAIDSGIQLTDEASAVEAYGHAVRMVEDRRDNIKITLPEDLLWAETILNNHNV